MDKITKLPWIIYEISLDGEIVGICKKGDEDKIVCGDMKLKDAEYICRAVNNHERLVEAAKMLEDLMTNWGSDFRIETKDLAATIQAGIMIEKFKEALNAVDVGGEK